MISGVIDVVISFLLDPVLLLYDVALDGLMQMYSCCSS